MFLMDVSSEDSHHCANEDAADASIEVVCRLTYDEELDGNQWHSQQLSTNLPQLLQ